MREGGQFSFFGIWCLVFAAGLCYVEFLEYQLVHSLIFNNRSNGFCGSHVPDVQSYEEEEIGFFYFFILY
jgi:hypothetical protein